MNLWFHVYYLFSKTARISFYIALSFTLFLSPTSSLDSPFLPYFPLPFPSLLSPYIPSLLLLSPFLPSSTLPSSPLLSSPFLLYSNYMHARFVLFIVFCMFLKIFSYFSSFFFLLLQFKYFMLTRHSVH